MPNTFFASDHHLGHQGMITFTRDDGSKLRDFDSVEEMNETFIQRHNAVVKPSDTIWFLGDVVINRRYLSVVSRFNGRKRLIAGNHDIFKNKDYFNAGFEDIHAFRKFDGFAATHIPIHSGNLGRWGSNVHGHTHARYVRLPRGFDVRTGEILYSEKPDPRYIPISMEHLTDWTPISLEEIREKIS